MHPTGTVTFLFTDLEESSRLWDQYPEEMQTALARHDAILREGVEANQGIIVKTTGDGLHAAFASPGDALQATFDTQRGILAQAWKTTGPMQVRMGLHTGQAQWRDGDYYGPAVNRAARVMSVAAGGQILLSQVTAELVRDQLPRELSLVDLGQQRLRSLDRPERLFQLQHPDLPADFPALESQRTTANNLPAQLSSFIGRERETFQVKELLAPDSGRDDPTLAHSTNRLITLIGPGGTGKTRLSLKVGHDLLGAYTDGVWLVELAPLTDPDLVVQAVAEPFGLSEQPGRPLIAMLADFLHSRKVLIILDNCEHVIDACAQLADDLLHRCPRLRILASSREALGIAGERVYRVRSLTVPDVNEQLPAGQLATYDAIKLFVARARAVKSNFSLTEENGSAVQQICLRLDGIPLAIELAAVRVRVLSPEQILQRLDDRFRLLTGGSRTALPRQRTLQALIDWSYDLLSEQECVLLRRLSVFSGGWTLEAAESVAGIEPIEPYEILDLLEQLNNKSLISAKEGDLGMRYSMLETVRQYAQLKLAESGNADPSRDRHLLYFVEMTENVAEAILDLRSADWMDILIADQDNLRTARFWALETDTRMALRMIANITPQWGLVLPAAEAMQYLKAALKKADSSPEFADPQASAEDRRLLGAVLLSGAFLSLGLGLTTAADYASRGAALSREHGDLDRLVMCLTIASASEGLRGEDDSARTYYQEIRELTADLEPGWVKAWIYTGFGLALMARTGDSKADAWKNWESGMSMFRQGGDFWGLAYGHQMAALASFVNNEPSRTEYHARRSVELYADLGDIHTINMPRSLLADIARQRGDFDRAEPLYQECASGWRNVAQYGALARCLECLAFVSSAQSLTADEQQQPQLLNRSSTLLGAADAIREVHSTPMTAFELAEFEQELASIKKAAGDEFFQLGWQRGQAMDPDQAVAYVQELSSEN